MTQHWQNAAYVYSAFAALFLIRNAYRWARWERHWPGARLWTLPLRSAFWPIAWIGMDWSPVRWAWRKVWRTPRLSVQLSTKDNISDTLRSVADMVSKGMIVLPAGYTVDIPPPKMVSAPGSPSDVCLCTRSELCKQCRENCRPEPTPALPPKMRIEISAKDNLSDVLRDIADLIPQTMTVLPAGYKFTPMPSSDPDFIDCPCYRCQSQGAHHTTYEVYAKAGVEGDGNTIRLAVHVENADSHEDARLAAIALIGKKYQRVGACHIELKETSVELMQRAGSLIPCCYRVNLVFRVIPTLREPSQTIQC